MSSEKKEKIFEEADNENYESETKEVPIIETKIYKKDQSGNKTEDYFKQYSVKIPKDFASDMKLEVGDKMKVVMIFPRPGKHEKHEVILRLTITKDAEKIFPKETDGDTDG